MFRDTRKHSSAAARLGGASAEKVFDADGLPDYYLNWFHDPV
jgi:hypothetical protein